MSLYRSIFYMTTFFSLVYIWIISPRYSCNHHKIKDPDRKVSNIKKQKEKSGIYQIQDHVTKGILQWDVSSNVRMKTRTRRAALKLCEGGMSVLVIFFMSEGCALFFFSMPGHFLDHVQCTVVCSVNSHPGVDAYIREGQQGRCCLHNIRQKSSNF